MFGQKSAFGTSTGGFGSGFGASTSTSTFGATTNQPSTFGQSGGTFGQPSTGTSLFGAGANTGQTSGGLFGQQPASTGFGGFGTTTTFGSTSSAFKPAGTGGFGASTSAFGGASNTTTSGMFGSTSQPNQSFSGFGGTSTFGSTAGAVANPGQASNTSFGAFGQQMSQVNGTTVKFVPTTSSDTMMKDRVQQQISTRHQCISCMKEYENKSLEELRMEDYLANRKGPQSGGTTTGTTGGLFGAPPNQQAPAASGGLFGSTNTQTNTGLFGAQQNKPLFGATSTSGFGSTNTQFGSTAGAFGTNTATNTGGLFGAKPTGFGAMTTTSSTGFGFNNTNTSTTTGGLFGQQQNQFGAAKPFGAAQPQTGGLFGSTATPAFGSATATPAFGQTNTFGAPAGQQNNQIGLFGQQNQNQAKPAFGFGATPGAGTTGAFGSTATATTTPSFSFGGATNTAFGQAKPAGTSFGFGQPNAGQPATSSAFGFGQPQQANTTGGLFGAAKPAFGAGTFGATSTTSTFGAPSFGANTGTSTFGAPGAANTGGGLFNSNAPKPLFGGGTSSFGSFGGANTGGTSFGAGTSFGGAGSFNLGGNTGAFGAANTAGLNASNVQGQAQPVVNASLQSQLASLTSNPYGDNPLFKHLLPDTNRREEIMKPTNPAAQKAALNSVTYKVSPHGLKAKVKPLNASKSNDTSLVNKSAIFDGLEEDESESKGDGLFVPRSSVKKLILKPKNPSKNLDATNNADVTLSVADSTSAAVNAVNVPDNHLEESLNLPSVKKLPSKVVNVEVHDESFSNLNTKRKELEDSVLTSPGDLTRNSNVSLEPPEEDDDQPQPAGIKLRRAGYYTIPSMSELSTMVDSEGNLNVENFTIGRQGYGNIFFPGMTNIKGMNFDDIVFFRHKEVIVYPDDSKKPELGQGLNKKAQVTLDKVWPVDKTSHSSVKSPEKLANMNYEDKLQKACLKLGARFVEYRPETGSWVFKVDHFSKYGLDDSDEDELIENVVAKKQHHLEPAKKVKTLQLRSATDHGVPPNVTLQVSSAPMTSVTLQPEVSLVEDESNLTSPMEETFQKINTGSNRVKLMKATLFEDDDEEEDMDVNEDQQKILSKPRPVILEARPTILEKRDLIEDIASSMLGTSTNRGLGGTTNESMNNQSMTSTLLKSQYLSMVASMKTPPTVSTSMNKSLLKSKKSSKAPRYTLQAGYDKQISLPNSDEKEDLESKVVVPKHVDHLLPLRESMLNSSNVRLMSDFSLFMSRTFRVSWAPYWSLANPGDSLNKSKVKEAATDVFIERQEPLELTSQIIDSFESWLEVHLENCVLSFDDNDIPKIEIMDGVNALHAHAEEAQRQYSVTQQLSGVKQIKDVLDLIVALWGRLRPPKLDEDIMEEDQEMPSQDTHKITMERKQALTSWLEKVSSDCIRKDLEKARNSGDFLAEILVLLSGNQRLEACDKAQEKSDHNLAMLISTASGPNLTVGQLVQNQMERWQESRTDKFIEGQRLKLYSLLAGNPVWPGTELTVNTCEKLDWLRAFGLHLWYLTSPASSISDALNLYEEAFQKDTTEYGAYARPPRPHYASNDTCDSDLFDIQFHLLKLYANKAHKIESIVVPKTYTDSPLDYKMGWLVSQILASLGYRHMARREMLHMDFAAQLESMGLWQWAIFVILHLTDPHKRSKLAREILGRNVIPSDEESGEREVFLQDRLGVPLAWIAEAKAVRAATECNYGDQAWYLLRAENWNEAHEVIVQKIAPDAIINEDYDFFFGLLQDLASLETHSTVTNWQTQGQVFYDFITVDMKIKELLRKRDEANINYDIQTLRPKVMSLCARINSLPVTCAKERLCQSEIAKRMAHLTRVVLELENSPQQSEILAQNLAQLPLPDDYMLQELRTINRIHMNELLSHKA